MGKLSPRKTYWLSHGESSMGRSRMCSVCLYSLNANQVAGTPNQVPALLSESVDVTWKKGNQLCRLSEQWLFERWEALSLSSFLCKMKVSYKRYPPALTSGDFTCALWTSYHQSSKSWTGQAHPFTGQVFNKHVLSAAHAFRCLGKQAGPPLSPPPHGPPLLWNWPSSGKRQCKNMQKKSRSFPNTKRCVIEPLPEEVTSEGDLMWRSQVWEKLKEGHSREDTERSKKGVACRFCYLEKLNIQPLCSSSFPSVN